MKISHLLRILHSLDLLSVGGDILETLGVVDGEDYEEALPGPHVLVPHGAVLLLACGVEDIQQTGLSVNNHLLPVRKKSLVIEREDFFRFFDYL